MTAARTADRARGERARLEVRVHPGARREGVRRRSDGALQVEVAAPAEGGRANAAVCALLARILGVRRGQVAVVRGQSARTKQLEVSGIGEAEARRRLDEAMEDEDADGE